MGAQFHIETIYADEPGNNASRVLDWPGFLTLYPYLAQHLSPAISAGEPIHLDLTVGLCNIKIRVEYTDDPDQPMPAEDDPLVTLAEAARRSGISPSTLYSAAQGRLPAVKIGATWLVRLSAVQNRIGLPGSGRGTGPNGRKA